VEVKLNINKEARKSIGKITVVFLSLIMIFSIGFTVITFNNSSQNSNSVSNVNSNVPEALYSKCGESVCFVGSQPIISFGSFKYPVQYEILK
jgi:flagellar basal body-associated protein FliL